MTLDTAAGCIFTSSGRLAGSCSSWCCYGGHSRSRTNTVRRGEVNQMKRPHWLSRHPPACTGVQCDRARLSRLDAEAAPRQSRRSTVLSSRSRGPAPRRDEGSRSVLIVQFLNSV